MELDHSGENDHTYSDNITKTNILYNPFSSDFSTNEDKSNIKSLEVQPFPSMGTY